jgi:hypothetical protein
MTSRCAPRAGPRSWGAEMMHQEPSPSAVITVTASGSDVNQTHPGPAQKCQQRVVTGHRGPYPPESHEGSPAGGSPSPRPAPGRPRTGQEDAADPPTPRTSSTPASPHPHAHPKPRDPTRPPEHYPSPPERPPPDHTPPPMPPSRPAIVFQIHRYQSSGCGHELILEGALSGLLAASHLLQLTLMAVDFFDPRLLRSTDRRCANEASGAKLRVRSVPSSARTTAKDHFSGLLSRWRVRVSAERGGRCWGGGGRPRIEAGDHFPFLAGSERSSKRWRVFVGLPAQHAVPGSVETLVVRGTCRTYEHDGRSIMKKRES